MEDLRSVIECNAVHMQSFAIDVVDWHTANHPPRKRVLLSERHDDDEDSAEEDAAEKDASKKNPAKKPSTNNFLARKALQLQPKTNLVVFSTLTELSLSNISFEGAVTELVSAFNVDMLRSLKLQNCRSWPEFLLALADSPKGMRLRVFHLSMDDRIEGKRSIETFLEAFEGLKELGLLIKPPMATPKYWNSILNHKSTLKNFVYHERLKPHFPKQRFVDTCPLTKRMMDEREILGTVFEELLTNSDLECLAICGELSSLVSQSAHNTNNRPAHYSSLQANTKQQPLPPRAKDYPPQPLSTPSNSSTSDSPAPTKEPRKQTSSCAASQVTTSPLPTSPGPSPPPRVNK